jgi:hypothetical protein
MRNLPSVLTGLFVSVSWPAQGGVVWPEAKVPLSVQAFGKPPITFNERIWAMRFGADGTELLTVTDSIHRTEWSSGKQRAVQMPHGNETMIRAVFSPDGSRFARDNNGNMVYVHEMAAGKTLHSFQGQDPRFAALAWSADGPRLAVRGGREVVTCGRIFSETGWQDLFYLRAIAPSPDGLHLAVGTTGGLRHASLEGPPVAAGTTPETLLNLMGGDDHWLAYQAAWALASQPGFIPFLESRLASAREPSPEMISLPEAQLADSSHGVRQAAARQWLDLAFERDEKSRAMLPKGARSAKWPGEIAPRFSGFPEVSPVTREQPVPPLIPLSAHRQAMRALMLLKASPEAAASRLLERLAAGHPPSPITRASDSNRD